MRVIRAKVRFMADVIDEYLARIGHQVRALRIASAFDQEALAARANVGTRSIQNLEAGRGSSLRTLVRVIRALGRDDWLDELDPIGTGPSPMELLREAERRSARPQRVRRKGS